MLCWILSEGALLLTPPLSTNSWCLLLSHFLVSNGLSYWLVSIFSWKGSSIGGLALWDDSCIEFLMGWIRNSLLVLWICIFGKLTIVLFWLEWPTIIICGFYWVLTIWVLGVNTLRVGGLLFSALDNRERLLFRVVSSYLLSPLSSKSCTFVGDENRRGPGSFRSVKLPSTI